MTKKGHNQHDFFKVSIEVILQTKFLKKWFQQLDNKLFSCKK